MEAKEVLSKKQSESGPMVQFLPVRTEIPSEKWIELERLYHEGGYPLDTLFIRGGAVAPNNEDDLVHLCQAVVNAGAELIVGLAPRPLPTKAIEAGFTHVVIGEKIEQLVGVRTEEFQGGRRIIFEFRDFKPVYKPRQ